MLDNVSALGCKQWRFGTGDIRVPILVHVRDLLADSGKAKGLEEKFEERTFGWRRHVATEPHSSRSQAAATDAESFRRNVLAGWREDGRAGHCWILGLSLRGSPTERNRLDITYRWPPEYKGNLEWAVDGESYHPYWKRRGRSSRGEAVGIKRWDSRFTRIFWSTTRRLYLNFGTRS